MDCIETVENPTFSSADFSRHNKKPGISAIVRLSNEEEYALASLESIEPFVDEIVIVINQCTDRTPEIVAGFAARNPRRVRAFHYLPRVAPLGSREHQTTSPASPHSFVHYCNFALSRSSFLVRFIWDGDQIAFADRFARVVQQLRDLKPGTPAWLFSPWGIGYWRHTGVNLWNDRGEILVPRSLPLAGRKGDQGFFPCRRFVRFKRYSHGEYLFTRLLIHRKVGCVYYHLKGMKKDRGVNKYRFNQNPDSLYKENIAKFWTDPKLITLQELAAQTPGLSPLPDPASLGIRAL